LFAIPLVAILMFTDARGPMLAFGAAVCTLVLMRMRPVTRAAVILFAAAICLAGIAAGSHLQHWLAAAANSDNPIAQIAFRGESADTLMELHGRVDLWDDLRPAIAAHPVVGYGYQASRLVVLDAASWAAYAHNALLQTVLDLGIVGTFALLVLIGIAFLGRTRGILPSWARAAALSLMVFLTVNAISTESFAGAPDFETLLLFVCALCVEV
jgi:O-antigen ligase